MKFKALLKKINIYLVLFLSAIFCLSCISTKQSVENFANEIFVTVKVNDAQKLYSLQVTPEIIAKYGFYDFVSSEEFNKIKSPSEFYDLTISNGEKRKGKRIEKIKESLDRIHLAYGWENSKIIKVESSKTEEKELTNIKSKEKVKTQLYKLNILVALRNGKQIEIYTPCAMEIDGKWVLYSTYNSGIDVNEK